MRAGNGTCVTNVRGIITGKGELATGKKKEQLRNQELGKVVSGWWEIGRMNWKAWPRRWETGRKQERSG